MVISFGKYRGQDIREIKERDINYLAWVAKNLEIKSKQKEINFIKELIAPDLERIKENHLALCKSRISTLTPVVNIIKSVLVKKALATGKTSNWCVSVLKSLEQGEVLSVRAREIITDVCAKASGRRNSKRYRETFDIIDQAFKAALEIT